MLQLTLEWRLRGTFIEFIRGSKLESLPNGQLGNLICYFYQRLPIWRVHAFIKNLRFLTKPN